MMVAKRRCIWGGAGALEELEMEELDMEGAGDGRESRLLMLLLLEGETLRSVSPAVDVMGLAAASFSESLDDAIAASRGLAALA